MGERRLPTAGASHQANHVPVGDAEVHVGDDWVTLEVGESDRSKVDAPELRYDRVPIGTAMGAELGQLLLYPFEVRCHLRADLRRVLELPRLRKCPDQEQDDRRDVRRLPDRHHGDYSHRAEDHAQGAVLIEHRDETGKEAYAVQVLRSCHHPSAHRAADGRVDVERGDLRGQSRTLLDVTHDIQRLSRVRDGTSLDLVGQRSHEDADHGEACNRNRRGDRARNHRAAQENRHLTHRHDDRPELEHQLFGSAAVLTEQLGEPALSLGDAVFPRRVEIRLDKVPADPNDGA